MPLDWGMPSDWSDPPVGQILGEASLARGGRWYPGYKAGEGRKRFREASCKGGWGPGLTTDYKLG